MQVFKVYFKILKKNIGSILMYSGIFIGLVAGVLVPMNAKNEAESYKETKSSYAVFDNDESKLSKGLAGFLKENHETVDIKDDSKETIQDELYNLNVDCVIRINEGFEEAFLKGEGEEYLEIYEIPNAIGAVILKQHINSYLAVLNTYMEAGFDMEEAIIKSAEATQASVDVELQGENNAQIKMSQYYYKYLAWIFIAMCVESLSVVLLALNKSGVKSRIECSPYKFVRMNMETLLAVLVTGMTICIAFVLISFVMFKEEMLQPGAMLYIVNSFCIMAVALAITFLVSRLTANKQIISLFSNVIGLGMAFLCGVFVPLEVMSKAVIKIAHFLPVYWNVKATMLISEFKSSDLTTILSCMGVQLLFAVAIVCIGMIVAGRKRVSA